MLSEFFSAVASLSQRVDLRWLLALIPAVLLHYLAEPSRWRVYLRRDAEATWFALFHVFSLTAFVGYTVPAKLGLPLRILLLRQRLGVPVAAVTALLGVDGALYYLSWAAASLVALPWAAGTASGAVSGIVPVAIAGAAIAMILLAGWWRAGRPGTGLLPRRIAQRLSRLLDSTRAAARPRALAAAAGITVLDILGQALRHWVLLAMIGHALAFPAVFAATSIAIFAGMVSLMPMGLGGYDIALVLILGLNGVPVADGVAVAVANRLVNLGVAAPLGLWSGAVLGIDAFNRRTLGRLAAGAGDSGAGRDAR